MKSPNHPQPELAPAIKLNPGSDLALLAKEVRFWDRLLHKSLHHCSRSQEPRIHRLIHQLHQYEKHFLNGNGKMEDQQDGLPESGQPKRGAYRELQMLKIDIMDALEVMLTPRII